MDGSGMRERPRDSARRSRISLRSIRATIMSVASALACARCGARYPLDHYASDCVACRRAGAPANLTVVYDGAAGQGFDRARRSATPASMWRWDAFLPASADAAVTLGEGSTPLLPA